MSLSQSIAFVLDLFHAVYCNVIDKGSSLQTESGSKL